MRNSKNLSFSLLVFSALVFAGLAGAGFAQGPKNEIFKRMETHARALSSVSGNVTMSKHDTLLDDYDVKKGNLYYVPGGKNDMLLRIDWTEPFSEILLIARGRYVFYRPKLKQAIVGKVSSANKNQRSNNALAFMTMSKRELNENYRTQYLGIESVAGKQMWHLKLFPKIKASYKNADLWVDGNGMPIQAKIVEKNDDSTTIFLSNLNKNVSIPGSTFQIKLPKDVKIIDG